MEHPSGRWRNSIKPLSRWKSSKEWGKSTVHARSRQGRCESCPLLISLLFDALCIFRWAGIEYPACWGQQGSQRCQEGCLRYMLATIDPPLLPRGPLIYSSFSPHSETYGPRPGMQRKSWNHVIRTCYVESWHQQSGRKWPMYMYMNQKTTSSVEHFIYRREGTL